MSSTRRFRPSHLFDMNAVNLDPLTETYNLHFYFTYMSKHPEYQQSVRTPSGSLAGYLISKAEGRRSSWHGHVSAITVGPAFRRLAVARRLMAVCEALGERDNCFFVDLFVRESNAVAIAMYSAFGYVVYRRIRGYYTDGEDALDMRFALSRDVGRKSVVPIGTVGIEDVEITL